MKRVHIHTHTHIYIMYASVIFFEVKTKKIHQKVRSVMEVTYDRMIV